MAERQPKYRIRKGLAALGLLSFAAGVGETLYVAHEASQGSFINGPQFTKTVAAPGDNVASCTSIPDGPFTDYDCLDKTTGEHLTSTVLTTIDSTNHSGIETFVNDKPELVFVGSILMAAGGLALGRVVESARPVQS